MEYKYKHPIILFIYLMYIPFFLVIWLVLGCYVAFKFTHYFIKSIIVIEEQDNKIRKECNKFIDDTCKMVL